MNQMTVYLKGAICSDKPIHNNHHLISIMHFSIFHCFGFAADIFSALASGHSFLPRTKPQTGVISN